MIAKKVHRILDNLHFFSSLISVAKTAMVALLTVIFYRLFSNFISGEYSVLMTIASMIVIVSFPITVIPKALATMSSEQYLKSAYFFYQLNLIFAPIALIMGKMYKVILSVREFDKKLAFLTEEEKERFNGDSEHGEMLDQDEQTMIRNIFEFGETTVREIMVPRIDIVALNVKADFDEVLQAIYDEGHSRIPIYEDNIDSIVGILYSKDILLWLSSVKGNFDPSKWDLHVIMKKPFYVPLNKKLDDLMTDMKTNQTHLVIVVDEYGGTAGICSLEDILEEIVGEIRDEYDETVEEGVVRIDQFTYLVDSHIELDELGKHIGVMINCDNAEYTTLGGLFYHEFGDVPEVGNLLEFQGFSMAVTKMDHQRIEEIRLVLPPIQDNVA